MKYLSICSGIEAATVAWKPLGWRAAGFSEIDAFPRALLAHHYPGVPLHGDFTQLVDAPPDCDLLVGGTPCQAFSIAGKRRSLGDERGNLTLQYVRLLDAIDKARQARGKDRALAVWENVPGVLNTRDNAFGCFLAALVGEDQPLEPGGKRWTDSGVVVGPKRAVAWRKLDAQYFRLAQRRQRVFALIGPRDWPVADALFPVEEGLRRDRAPSRSAGQGASGTTALGVALRGRDGGNTTELGDGCSRMDFTVETFCVTGPVTHTLRAEGHDAMEDGTGRGTPIVPVFLHCNKGRPAGRKSQHVDIVSIESLVPTLMTDGHARSAVVAFTCKDYGADAGEIAPTLRAMSNAEGNANSGGQVAVQIGAAVRRLTPRECERLQGFPDDYTLVPYRSGKEAADGPRYKALGNSMAVNCMRWLGQRIEAVQADRRRRAN